MPSQHNDSTVIENEKQLIRQAAGLSDADQIFLNDRGWDSRVYSFADGRYFFKFPRSEKVQSLYKYEIAAIKFVSHLDSDVASAKIMWEHPENAYFGYEGVQGLPLAETIQSLSEGQRRSMGQSLGAFLKQFHEVKLSGARTKTIEDEAAQIQRWYNDGLEIIRQHFNEEEREKLHRLVYEIWPGKLAELGADPVLSHGDLHFENILYEPGGSIGVIDFGDVAYYDRSKDFLDLDPDKVFLEAVLEAYGHNDENFAEKIRLRRAMTQIINLVFFAEKADKQNVELTVKKIKSNLN